jgi:uncharacterized cupin superfamily protein
MEDLLSTQLVHTDADVTGLPEAKPKPTSLNGQVESTHKLWENADGVAGVWECSAGEFTTERIGFSEVCQILSGRATLVAQDGTKQELVPGSLVVLPDGWRGSWIVHETVRKTYVTIHTSAAKA